MSEIKFACPHCQQHIACDPGFAEMCIVCPTCGKPMVVPVLSASDSGHPEMCVVASLPMPRRKLTAHIPQLHVWQAEEWEEHLRANEATAVPQIPRWVVCAFGTTIVVGFLYALIGRPWIVASALILGIALCCYFAVKGGNTNTQSPVYQALGWVLVVILGIPVILVGVAFVGCCVAN